jgi:NADH dehydrogenase
MVEDKQIVVVGGGFAGVTLVRRLARRLPPHTRLLLISEENYTTYNPMLPEAVGASIFPEHVVAPLRELLMPDGRSRFVLGRVSSIDLAARLVRCETLSGARDFAFDHLVLAVGNRARLDLIEGMAEHALPLKTVGDAMVIRNTVLRRLNRIELETDPALRAALGRFVVIGGGFSGVEVAGELIDCIRSIRPYFPGVRDGELGVTVLHDGPRLLPELSPALGEAALRSLRKRGVEVRLGARARAVSADGAHLTDGSFLPSATVIGTIGTQPNALVARLGLPLERGRIAVQADLSVPGHEGVWAVGDCALVPNAYDGAMSPPTAQFAVRQGCQLAANLCRLLGGRATKPFHHRPLGSMAALGHMKGVASVFGLSLSGLPAWLLWRAYYLSQMPTLGRRVRIFVEWTWGMFFPADITHLRFHRSSELAQAEVAREEVSAAP